MAKVEVRRNIFKKGPPPNEDWGDDWTKSFNPDDLLPGTVLLDPHAHGNSEIKDDNLRAVLERPPLVLDSHEYRTIATALGIEPALVASYLAGVFYAHNERTKFGSRRVAVATPVIMDGTQFEGNEDMIPYFLLEQELQLATAIPRLLQEGVVIDIIGLMFKAKVGAMETALHHGQLQRYLQLHDIFYPPNSTDESDKRQFNLRVDAESHVIGEYTTVWSIISAGFRGLMGVTGQGDIHAGMQQIQHKKGYTPHPLKQVIYQR